MIYFNYLTNEVILRNPSIGDAENLDLNTDFSIAEDGTVTSKVQDYTNKILTLSFLLLDNDYDNLISFIDTCGAETIQYTDKDSVVWDVKILSETVQYTQEKEKTLVSLQVIGAKV